MSTADLQSAALARGSTAALVRPEPRRRLWRRIARIIGGFLVTGLFLALSVPVFALSVVYAFVWFARHQ